ncbi:MAG: type I-C CRISPR-associated endonuclease Cas1c [candidate division KSB1 bacterium]|nr:type I-C CRISPR-associated endonuclease Cas1c [candidate division KSB1 bacterium]
MKPLLNTLYVTQPESLLLKEGETVLVRKGEEKLIQVPIHTLSQIICFGITIYVSPPLMALCSERGVSITWLTESGRFLARLEGRITGYVLLRRTPHRWGDSAERALAVARNIVAAKINNSRINLLRRLRGGGSDALLQEQIDHLAALLPRVAACSDLEVLRGLEGEAANGYFSVFDRLIVQQKDAFIFAGRNRRPPLDPVNALLSFVYTLLALDIQSALETVGLDPFIGFLHADRPGRPGLALDLMEEFRAPLADRLVLNLINLKQVDARDFRREGVEVRMTDDCRKRVITAYQNRKKEMIVHPFLEERMEIGVLFHAQAQLLARHIRGDLDYYPAILWR